VVLHSIVGNHNLPVFCPCFWCSCSPSQFSKRSGRFHWEWSWCGYTRSENHLMLFCCPSSAAHLHHYITDDGFRQLVVSFIHSRLNFGNLILVGLPACLQQ